MYTAIGNVLAALMLVSGLFKAGVGLAAALNNNPGLVRRYVGSMSSGEAIDSGAMMLAAAVALGIFCEISRSVRR